ncbi:hypothetical protein RUND412_006882 [Rhizina undulata]
MPTWDVFLKRTELADWEPEITIESLGNYATLQEANNFAQNYLLLTGGSRDSWESYDEEWGSEASGGMDTEEVLGLVSVTAHGTLISEWVWRNMGAWKKFTVEEFSGRVECVGRRSAQLGCDNGVIGYRA